jgi:hypothetical protein
VLPLRWTPGPPHTPGWRSARADMAEPDAPRRNRAVRCAACRDALCAGTEQVAELAARPSEARGQYGICGRHLDHVLAEVSHEKRGQVVAHMLESAAAAIEGRWDATSCEVCAREQAAADRAADGPLCLHHLRQRAAALSWEAVSGNASILLQAVEHRDRRELPQAIWGSPDVTDVLDDHHACPLCAARTAARLRHFEWLSDAAHRFPGQAAPGSVALCSAHGWSFVASSPGSARLVLDHACDAWARRLGWLLTGMECPPADRLGARMAALPATLSSLMDDAGRLPLAVIVRATATAVLRSPAAVLTHLAATAFATEDCPVCVAEQHASLEAAASGRGAVCPADLHVVRHANRDRSSRRAVRRATADSLRKEAAVIRPGVRSTA